MFYNSTVAKVEYRFCVLVLSCRGKGQQLLAAGKKNSFLSSVAMRLLMMFCCTQSLNFLVVFDRRYKQSFAFNPVAQTQSEVLVCKLGVGC